MACGGGVFARLCGASSAGGATEVDLRSLAAQHWAPLEEAAEDVQQSFEALLQPVAATLKGEDARPLSVVIFGATGDLARKKLYPALYQLLFGCPEAPLLPRATHVVGYGRSAVVLDEFLEKQCVNVRGVQKGAFLQRCSFFAGAYDKPESYTKLHEHLCTLEGGGRANRLFFFSIPPTIFGDVVKCIKASACAPDGWTRLVLEKPFGRDSRTFAELNATTASLFSEDELFRIDHYLGKEVVLNMVALRFGNQIFSPSWNREYISSVQIVFKEDLGTGGRGGYFDGFGIVRDIMQNHLLQVLMWIAMEPPAALDRSSIAKCKVDLLKAMPALTLDDSFLGQFTKASWTVNGELHEEPGYLDDATVPAGSLCPTYAAVVLRINNARWHGVPFLMRAGKGLDERLAEVRVTFKHRKFNVLVPGNANELVMRIQPDEAIYLKMLNKRPGLSQSDSVPVVLDMSYATSFTGGYVADAYERMFLNAARGDGSLFVGSEELTEAWRIFTPLLDAIDAQKPQPVLYPFGVRVPEGMDAFAKRYGVVMSPNWQEFLARAAEFADVDRIFRTLDTNGNGRLEGPEIQALMRRCCDGLEPSAKQVANVMQRLDADGDGTLSLEELKRGLGVLAGHTRQWDHTGFSDERAREPMGSAKLALIEELRHLPLESHTARSARRSSTGISL